MGCLRGESLTHHLSKDCYMKGFMVPAAAFTIAVGLVYGGGKLLKKANVPAPYTFAGFATSAIWAGAYRRILSK